MCEPCPSCRIAQTCRPDCIRPPWWGGAVREFSPLMRTQPDWIGCDLSSYRLRLAETEAERAGGVPSTLPRLQPGAGRGAGGESYANGMDQDAFDDVCEHLLVEEKATGRIVGTYRMQSGVTGVAQPGLLQRAGVRFRAV